MSAQDLFDDSRLLRFDRFLQDREGLVAFRKVPSSTAALIFFHGFSTTSLSTWGYNNQVFWPYDLCKAIAVDGWCFNYFNAALPSGNRAPLSHVSVADQFLDAARDKLAHYSRVVFVTHSFGGLLAKAIVVAASRGDHPDYERILKKTFGLFAMACPNRGHWLATLAGSVPWAAHNLKLLRGGAEIEELDFDFREARSSAPNLDIEWMHEGKSIGLLFRISEKNARFERASAKYESGYDHSAICKDLNPDREEWRVLQQFVTKRLNASGARSLLR